MVFLKISPCITPQSIPFISVTWFVLMTSPNNVAEKWKSAFQKPRQHHGNINQKIWKLITHQIFSLACDWSNRVTWLNMPRQKLENIWVIFSNFQNCACCEKYLKDNTQKTCSDICPWTSSKPIVFLERNCSLLGTSADKYPSMFRAVWRLLFFRTTLIHVIELFFDSKVITKMHRRAKNVKNTSS